jgi:dTDP-4-dehydrorhamnose reductase
MTRILLTGAGGMLGHDLVAIFADADLDARTRGELDISDAEAAARVVEGVDVVINAAAYTKVDDAETERDLAFAINADGPRNLARACKTHGARFIHVSTDYVFDGNATAPYLEHTPRNPASVYGQSKAAGEEAIEAEYPDGSIIIRTAWLYGQHGPNFPRTMLRLAQSHDSVNVVTDQVGQPTWTKDLAGRIRLLVESDIQSGVFHGTNSGQTSWFEFAREVYRLAGLDPERIQPTTSDEFPRLAPRPSWSVLGHDAWQNASLPEPRDWREALTEAFPVCFEAELS